jgi:hypothetical protein
VFKNFVNDRESKPALQHWSDALLRYRVGVGVGGGIEAASEGVQVVHGFMTWELSFLYGTPKTCPRAPESVADDFNTGSGDPSAPIKDLVSGAGAGA